MKFRRMNGWQNPDTAPRPRYRLASLWDVLSGWSHKGSQVPVMKALAQVTLVENARFRPDFASWPVHRVHGRLSESLSFLISKMGVTLDMLTGKLRRWPLARHVQKMVCLETSFSLLTLVCPVLGAGDGMCLAPALLLFPIRSSQCSQMLLLPASGLAGLCLRFLYIRPFFLQLLSPNPPTLLFVLCSALWALSYPGC
jgi:hypothetical protein